MSERGAGSSSGFESSTRTARPPRASFAAVYNPAADPPTTIISCFSRLERELSFGSPTLVNLSRNCSLNWPTRRPRRCLDTTKNPPGSLARGSALAIGRPLSIANPVPSANASAGKIQTNGKPPRPRLSCCYGFLRLLFVRRSFEQCHTDQGRRDDSNRQQNRPCRGHVAGQDGERPRNRSNQVHGEHRAA